MRSSEALLPFIFLNLFIQIHGKTSTSDATKAAIKKYPYIVTFKEGDSEEINSNNHGVLIDPSWVLTTRSVIESLPGVGNYKVVARAASDACEKSTTVTTPTTTESTTLQGPTSTAKDEVATEDEDSTSSSTTEAETTTETQCATNTRQSEKSFVFKDSWFKADMGLIKLSESFNTSEDSGSVKPISLPKKPFSLEDCKNPMIVGYDVSKSEGNGSSPLQTLDVELLNLTYCGRQSPLLPDMTTICINTEFCPRNKGQALICADEDEHYLIGLLSRLDKCRDPYTVTNVSSVMKWIHGISKIEVEFKTRPKFKDPSTVDRYILRYSSKAQVQGINFHMVLSMIVIIYILQ